MELQEQISNVPLIIPLTFNFCYVIPPFHVKALFLVLTSEFLTELCLSAIPPFCYLSLGVGVFFVMTDLYALILVYFCNILRGVQLCNFFYQTSFLFLNLIFIYYHNKYFFNHKTHPSTSINFVYIEY